MSQNSQKTPVAESFFNKVASLTLQRYYKETLEQVFSSEFSVIFKKTCFKEHLRTTVCSSVEKRSLSYFHNQFNFLKVKSSEAVAQRCSQKFRKIHRKAPVPEFSATLLKKGLWHRCFLVNFAKFIRAPFLTEHLRWLLLNLHKVK